MQIDDMTIHMITLRSAYPHSWPKELSTEAILGTWYDSFQHIPNDLFTGAVKHAIATYEWPSIKDMWESILTVAGVPSLFDAQEAMRRYTDRCYNIEVPKLPIEKHPLIKKTLQAMGDHSDIAAMGVFAQANLKNFFVENRKAYRDMVMKPHNTVFLIETYKLQLPEGDTKQIEE